MIPGDSAMPRQSVNPLLIAAAPIAVQAAVAALALSPAPRWVIAAVALVGAMAAWAALLERRRVEQRLGALEDQAAELKASGRNREVAATRLQEVVDALGEPIVAINADGLVVVWNHGAERLFELPAARAAGRPFDEVFTQAEVLRLHAAAREGRPVRERVRVRRPDGPRVWDVSAVPAGRGAGGQAAVHPVVMEVRDVTEEARSLQVKTDFVANASHELRTPLASMRLALETLSGLGDDDGPMRERLMAMLSGNVARMEEMVRDLLDLSRLESPEATVRTEPAPGSELARMLAADFAAVCQQRNLTLTFDFDPALEGMRTDRKLLGLILGNLIDNATKFAFEGTEIRVVGRPLADHEGVRLEVIDRGIGIPLDQQARVFERYYQVDQARGSGQVRRGTGLGLAIVKHAVRRLGGTIKVQSVYHQGTTMTVELPGVLGPGGGDTVDAAANG